MIPRRKKAPKMGLRVKPWWRSHSYKQFIKGFECCVAGVLDPCSGHIEQAQQINTNHGFSPSANLKRRNHDEHGAGCQIMCAA